MAINLKWLNFVCLMCIISQILTASAVNFEEKCNKYNWFNTKLNHFSYSNQETFKLRYIMNTENWKADKPIFFYCGNEADIEAFCNEMGFLWESSVEFQAMVVFAEHRYFGLSMPYGNKTFDKISNLEYLSPEQALLDFVFLLEDIKMNTKGAENSKIIAFGGSYGGMLSYMIRIKYPHLIDGALAASAPLRILETNCYDYYNYVTKVFSRFGSLCSDAIRKSFVLLESLSATQDGRDQIANIFRLCNKDYKLDEYKVFLRTQYMIIAMSDYPYETSIFQPLPAWPVKQICQKITNNNLDLNDNANVLEHVYSGLNIWFNYTGNKKCNDFGPPDNIPLEEYVASNYLWCTSIFTPFCSTGKTDMFFEEEFDFEKYSNTCYSQYGIRPSKDWLRVEYGVQNIEASFNIIFSNGDLDPLTAFGVLNVQSDKLNTILVKDGAHHLDLWTSNKDDPKSVTDARNEIKKIIHKWIEQPDSSSIKIQNSNLILMILVFVSTSYFLNQICFRILLYQTFSFKIN